MMLYKKIIEVFFFFLLNKLILDLILKNEMI